MTPPTEKKIEIFYDHYKDTFENQKIYLQRRNFYTLICITLIAFLAVQVLTPDTINQISDELIKKKIGELKIDYKYINSIILFGLLWSVILYYQSIFLIEKMYKYIHELEDNLSTYLKPIEIKREGKNYLSHYPLLLSLIHRIYTWIFPLLLIAVAVVKWFSEYQIQGKHWNLYFIFDTIILSLIVLTTLLYLSNRHFNDFKKKENKEEDDEEENEASDNSKSP